MIKTLRAARLRFWRDSRWQSGAHRRWFRFCAVCLSLYAAYLTFLAQSPVLKGGVETLLSLLWYAIYAAGLYALLLFACQRLRDCAPAPRKKREKLDPRLFAIGMGISLCILGCVFIACFPGGENYDISNQWQQAHTGEFNNWHPVFHTLLLWLATRVVDARWFVVALQIIAFSAAVAYLSATFSRHGVPGWLALLAQALVVASPPVRDWLMYPGKDAAMCVGAAVLTAQSVRMLFTGGRWLYSWRNAAAFGLALAFTTLVRHNALLFTLPLLLCALLCYRGGRRFQACAAGVALACVALVQGPLYGALDVVYPNNLVEESVGIPMTILCDVKTAAPELLDAETNAFLDGLASEETWRNTYRKGDYNSIKFTWEREKIGHTPVASLLGMALHTVARAPRLAFETVNNVTGLVWDVTGKRPISSALKIADSWRGALYALVETPMSAAPLSCFFETLGPQFLLLLLVTLWALYRGGVRALSLALPTLCYHLTTMLLLCGNDGRFFLFSMVVSVPSILALLYAPISGEAGA